MVIGGLVTVRWLGLEENVPYEVLPWFFTFMVFAILMLGSTYAALGSACNDAKEAQSVTFPAMDRVAGPAPAFPTKRRTRLPGSAIISARRSGPKSPPSRSSFAMQALFTRHFMWGGYYPVGGSREIVHVELDPQRVAGFGMTLDDLRRALTASNTVAVLSKIWTTPDS